MRTDIDLELHSLNVAERDAALSALDRLSRPLTIREIDHALARQGVQRSYRYPLINAIKHLRIIAIVDTAAAE